jgi:AcrR family transcriptional regulator
VPHAAPAHHFANRTELLAELAADGFAGLADALEGALDTAAPSRWLEVTAGAYVRFALANPERYRLMFTSRLTREECPARLDGESSRAYRALLRAVHRTDPVGDPAAYRLAAPELRAWSIVHGAVMLWLDGQLGDSLSEREFLERIDEAVATQANR